MADWLFHRGNDLTTQFLPDALFFRDSILSGKFPFWNPWIFAGMPYLLDPQNFLWYPPNYVLLLFRSVELGFLVLLVGHLIFTGYFIRKLLRTFPVWVQLFGVSIFLFSPKLVAHLEEGNWTLVIAAMWLPALYWALVNQRFWWMVVSLSVLIVNNLNIGYYALLFVGLFFFLRKRTVLLNRKRSDLIRSDLMKLGKLISVLALLTLPRWLPLVLWGDQTVRTNLSEPSLPFWSWTKIAKSLVVPLAIGHPQLQNEEILYVGIIPILLLAWKGRTLQQGPTLRNLIWNGLALLSSKGLSLRPQGQSLRNALKRFWMIWLVFVFLVTFNVKTPFFPLIQLLPGFSLLRITTRPWIFVALFVALVVPAVLLRLSQKSRLFAVVMGLGVLGEFWIFGYKLFNRRIIPVDPLPLRFYERMIEQGVPVRAYCTTGCIDRLTAQKFRIALLHGNNPIQLNEFVRYLQEAGGYRESSYHPILPPYTVFNQHPQPNAGLLGKTATKFVVSPYELIDSHFVMIDREEEYRLYQNKATLEDFKDHFFELQRGI